MILKAKLQTVAMELFHLLGIKLVLAVCNLILINLLSSLKYPLSTGCISYLNANVFISDLLQVVNL